MNGRLYTIPISLDSVSAALDVLELAPASNKCVELLGVTLTVGGTTNMQLQFRTKRMTGSLGSGTGGSSPTPVKGNTDDAANGFTVEMGNTSRATGTSEVIDDQYVPSQGGYDYRPTPEEYCQFNNSEYLVVGLEAAPAAAISIRGTVRVREL